ncbi:conserved protein of unknown function [Tenacibaculum sp. 190130A14a]|uniref:DKNYY family protein n=1 Tax=Tenacibaculum polynesiense TaxID=3137857 RepID=A0ABM9PEG3_9FLAO
MRLFFLFFSILFLSCTENKDSISIEGNWYIGDLATDENEFREGNENFVYQELYINKSQFFHFKSIIGFRKPYYYKIENDTLFLRGNKNEDFESIGKLTFNKKGFSVINKEGPLNFFRLQNVDNTLDKFIKKKDNSYFFEQKGTKYTQGFLDRKNEYYTKLKSKRR